jgi:hypothetical protein
VTLTEILESWVEDAERMHDLPARALVLGAALLEHLSQEQGRDDPAIAGLPVVMTALDDPLRDDLADLLARVEIEGPDRVCIYVGVTPEESSYPAGLDPAMPVVFVPVPPRTAGSRAVLEMYNRLRWYGLTPDEAIGGAAQEL